MTTWQAVACATGMLVAYAVEQNLPQTHPGADPLMLVQLSAGADLEGHAMGRSEPAPALQAMAESESVTTAAAQAAADGDTQYSTPSGHR